MSGPTGPITNNPTVRPGTGPIPAPPPPKKEGRGLFGHIADVFIGGGEAVWDVGKGLVTMVTHPIQTVKGIGYVVTHPGTLVDAFVGPYSEAIGEGRPGKAIGRGIVEIGSLFITGGGSGAAAGGAKGLSAAAKAAQAANAVGKAGKVAQVAAATGKAGKLAATAGKAAKVLSGGAKAASATKPIFSKAAALAAKNAGIADDVARAATAAAKAEYLAARAAGKTAQVAKAAAAAKAAKLMGDTKNAAVVEKVVNSARLSGAAAKSAQVASKVSVSTRISRAAAAARGIPTKVTTYVASTAKAVPAKIGAAVEKVGAITVKDMVLAPVTAGRYVMGSARNVISSAWNKLPGRGAKVANVADDAVKAGSKAAKAAKAAEAAEAAGKAGLLMRSATTAGKLIKDTVTLPFRVTRGAMAKGWQAGKWLGTHPKTWTPITLSGRAAEGGIKALYGASGLDDAQVSGIAQQFGLKPTRPNVEKFIQEIQGYQGQALGPDSGSPEEVSQLQVVLKALGYAVEPTGTFDDATTQAVIDFKGQMGITQGYLMADDTPGINEYVDENTAQALVAALKGEGAKPGTTANPAGTTANPTATETPVAPAGQPGLPAPAGQTYKSYTVGQMDRATGLSGIARHYLGDSGRWKEIYDLNKDLIGDNPNMILPGQKLRMPADAKGLPIDKAAAPAAVASPPEEPATPVTPAPAAAEPAVQATPAPTPKPATLDAEAQKLATQYNLAATPENVQAFISEINSYKESAIGPDVGSADDLTKLQRVLAALGYQDVKETGKFDEATDKAVMDFKTKNNLHQSYKLADGTWAINEYVDEATAKAMADALGK